MAIEVKSSGLKTDFVFTGPPAPSFMRTENWEAEELIHTETVSLICSCGLDHEDHLAAIKFSIKVLTQ